MGDNLSKIRLPEKYKAARTLWLRDLPDHIKIRRRAESYGREMTLEELRQAPEPGYGLDGYPLQKGR